MSSQPTAALAPTQRPLCPPRPATLRQRTTVYYDGGCPVCQRGMRHFGKLDWAGRLHWVDLIEHPEALRGDGVDFAAAMETIHVRRRDGRLCAGGHAFIALWSELPGYRYLAKLLTLSHTAGGFDRVYRRLTRGRYRRRCQDGLCVANPATAEFSELPSSFGNETVTPDERARRVKAMFERIAPRYDIMNDLMSGGIHRLWKRRLIWAADPRPGERVLDLAGGTGDLAKQLAARGCEVLVCDPATAMMRHGRTRATNTNTDADTLKAVGWVAGTGEALPLADASIDTLVVAFGLRNMTSPTAALAEARRVLRPGGRLVCLEFSHPHPLVRPLYNAFSRTVIPALGAVVAWDRGAYRYLIDSIRRFPNQEALAALLRQAGFSAVRYRNVSFGIACIHIGELNADAI